MQFISTKSITSYQLSPLLSTLLYSTLQFLFPGIYQLASYYNAKVENCALGQGQAPTAVKMIEDGMKQGTWVFLANCHLMLSWMSTLEKMIEAIMEGSPNQNFRLWLSSSPNPEFPISILQRGIKMTTEPPKGLRSNMLTLYNTIGDEQFNRCAHESTYKKLLFSLVWFHAILLERRKFKSLGFNVSYDFNESDFAICHDLIIVFLDEYPDRIPFDAMKYLIAEANYGGRVTDDWDRRLVNVYIAELFCEDCVQAEKFMLSDLADYYVPEDGDLKFYKEVGETVFCFYSIRIAVRSRNRTLMLIILHIVLNVMYL